MGRNLRNSALYEDDFYSWTNQQAELLRAGRFSEIDVSNIAEEIETLGRSEASSLEASFRLIVMHLLKMTHQPERARSRSWKNTIGRERINAERTLRTNPGLKPRIDELYRAAYADARKLAALEVDLPLKSFPDAPEFTLDQVLDEQFLPIDQAPNDLV